MWKPRDRGGEAWNMGLRAKRPQRSTAAVGCGKENEERTKGWRWFEALEKWVSHVNDSTNSDNGGGDENSSLRCGALCGTLSQAC